MLTYAHSGLDPYGTPISSQTGLHDLDKPQSDEVISIRDSPLIGRDDSSEKFSQRSLDLLAKKHRSPEIPTSNANTSQSQEAPSEVPTSRILSSPNQDHQTSLSTDMIAQQPASRVQGIRSPASQEPATAPPAKQPVAENASETPLSSQKNGVKQPGRLRRLKPQKPFSASKNAPRVINGVRQKVPSIFDPIETSEGSSHEREQLRSIKRARIGAASDNIQRPKVAQASSSNNPHFLKLKIANLGPTPPPKPKDSRDRASLGDLAQPVLVSHKETSHVTAPNIINTKAPPSQHLQQPKKDEQHEFSQTEQPGKASPSSNVPYPQEQHTPMDRIDSTARIDPDSKAAVAQPKAFSARVGQVSTSIVEAASQDEDLERQLKEAEENKRKAQAEFDRIAALQTKSKQTDKSKQSDAASNSRSLFSHSEVSREPVYAPISLPRQRMDAMSIEEQRQHNLKHLTPGWNKQLNDMFRKKGTELQMEKEQQAAIRKQDRATRLEAQKQGRAETSEDQHPQMSAEKRAAEDARITSQGSQARPVKPQQKRPSNQALQTKESRSFKQGTRLKQSQQAEEEDVKDANFPMPTRIAKKPDAQLNEQVERDLIGNPTEKVKQINRGRKSAGTESRLQVQNQNKGASTGANSGAADVERERGEYESAPQQVVGEQSQSWLIERSPKAKYNAQRQLQLANSFLKHTKRDSLVVKFPLPAQKSLSTATELHRPTRPQVTQSAARKVSEKQRQGTSTVDQQRKAINKNFTDTEALRAAGLFVASSTTTKGNNKPSSCQQASSISKRINTSSPSSNLPRTVGGQKVVESRFATPSADRIDRSRIRTMTPAIPSSSTKSNVASVETGAIADARATAVGSGALKTPVSNASRATPGASRRSVSFAQDIPPSSQSFAAGSHSSLQVSGEQKGLLHRALAESNAKEAEVIEERSKSTSSSQQSILNKVNRPQMQAKQTKLTQHISRDLKLKGKGKTKAPASSSPKLGERIVISSASEASTFFSDESEEERNARAGPSSKKKMNHGLDSNQSAGENQGAALKRSSNEGLSNNIGVAPDSADKISKTSQPIGPAPRALSSGLHGSRDWAPKLVGPSAISTMSPGRLIGSRSPQSMSTSSPESDSDHERRSTSGHADDVALLPRINGQKQDRIMLNQQNSQKNTTPTAASDQAHSRISSSLEPMAPKNEIEDVRKAKLGEERRQSEEADLQLQREYREAIQRDSLEKAATRQKANRDAIAEGPTSSSQPTNQPQSPKNTSEAVPMTNGGYHSSALTKLRRDQAKAEPVNVQSSSHLRPKGFYAHDTKAVERSGSSESDSGTSSSESSVDADVVSQNQAQAATTPYRSRFKGFKKEIFGGKI